MNWKFSANAGFFGAQRNRFVEYQPDRSLEEKVRLVAQVEGVTGIELKYPSDFQDLKLVKSLLERYELALSAVNVDTKDAARFRYGALSARAPAARREAIRRMREGMDVAAELGVELVTTCPLADGYDYPFQVDFGDAWGHFIETVRTIVAHRADVKVCLEYQPHEPHARILLNNVGMMLYVCNEVGAPNLGANLDIGHAFAALESPAEAATLLARQGRLFYIHTNDNPGDGGDWDMMSGTVHFWHWLELLYTLECLEYEGWLGADLIPKEAGPVEVFQTNVRMVQRLTALLQRMGVETISALLAQDGNVAETFDYLSERLVSPD